MPAKKYPAFLNLEGRNVLLIGGGNVAWEKLPNLVLAKANVTIVSLHFNTEVSRFLEDHPEITVEKREVEFTDLDGRDLIFSATNNKILNRNLVLEANRRKIWINSCDDPENCDFYSSAVFDKGPIRIAVSTDGKFAGLGGMMKKRLQEAMDDYLPEEHLELWEEILETRQMLKSKIGNIEERKVILMNLLNEIKEKYLGENRVEESKNQARL
ncbi:MAG: bifunctional precorrin-2 dehydrogenase/sirohydrochlorin ferrochelatase [Leptospira sp.]|nr:bifunctional precorrin-2 dehydrogenase/sirohydrochlorin ferrochelatase [Leptospira sp.]